MENEEAQRIVAIVGRPNVGKSAMFNRLARRRIAIVHEQAGVTRDRLVADVRYDSNYFKLIDTGGLGYLDGTEPDDVIDEGIEAQASVAMQDASVVILAVDITAGILPLDREVAKLLHQSGHTVLVAANKADTPEQDDMLDEFSELGFPVFAVSAMHNRGFLELVTEIVKHLPAGVKPADLEPLNVAIVGRPNAGKSSFINRLIRNDRVIVSDIPGTTRDSIDVPFQIGSGPTARHYLLIDTAGMKKMTKVKDTVERYSYLRTERSIMRSDVVVLVVDATEGPKGRDKKLISMILDKKKACIILVNKWDLAEDESTQRAYGAALQKELPYLDYVPVLFTSAETGYNIRNVIEAIDYVADQVSTTLSTGLLNRVLREAFEKTQPPMVKSTRLKMFYATQISSNPLRIKLFVNNPKKTTPQYTTYLIRTLREKFGLDAAPIYLLFGARKQKDDED